MKKFLAILLALTMVLSLCACKKAAPDADPTDTGSTNTTDSTDTTDTTGVTDTADTAGAPSAPDPAFLRVLQAGEHRSRESGNFCETCRFSRGGQGRRKPH